MSMLRRLVCLLCLGLLPLPWARATQPPALEIEGLSDKAVVEFDERSGVATDPVGVRVTYGDTVLTAHRVQINRDTGEVSATGDVRLRRGKELWEGQALQYNFLTHRIIARNFRVGVPPFFAAGQNLTTDLTNHTYTATNAVVTTDDLAKPFYRVRAKYLRIVPGQYIEAKDATLYLGKVPVMYFPSYHRNLYRHPNNFVFVPGYRSLYGPFLLGTYNWFLNTNFSAALHFDYRQKRGVAGGPDFNANLGPYGKAQIKSYFTHDDNPGLYIPPPDQTGATPPARPIKSDRERAAFTYSAFINTNLTVKVAVRQQSDPYVIRDFFESEYQHDVQPKSFLEADQLWPNFSLNLEAQPQVNNFFQTVERLPDVKLSAFRQQLGVSPFYYESDSSLAYLRFRPGDYVGTNFAALRGDSFHQIFLPETFFGWLNITPRVGGRFTYYGQGENTPMLKTTEDRWVFNTGTEVSTKASRVWRGAHSKLLDVHGLRHIIQPSVDYVYVPRPNVTPNQLPQFDHEWYSFEPLPIDYPEYNSIDSIDSQNVIRFSLNNRLQTKRAGGMENLVNWAMFMDWRLRPRSDQATFSDVYSDLDFKPRSWLTFNSEVRFDMNTKVWNMANHTITIRPNDRWSWKIGHRYLRALPELGPDSGDNLILSSIFYKLNENWAVHLVHHFQASDGTLQEQDYTIYRDMRSWTAALTFRVRQNQTGPKDYTVALTFSLKAFPRFSVGQDSDEPTSLLGG